MSSCLRTGGPIFSRCHDSDISRWNEPPLCLVWTRYPPEGSVLIVAESCGSHVCNESSLRGKSGDTMAYSSIVEPPANSLKIKEKCK